MAKGGNNTDGKMNVIILVAFTSFISEYFWVLSTISLLQMPKQTSGSDKTKKKKFLDVQLVRGEILFHNHPQSDGHYLSKKRTFFCETFTYFWHFYRLRPYFCSKRGVLGFYKQATYRRLCDEPFFYVGVHC